MLLVTSRMIHTREESSPSDCLVISSTYIPVRQDAELGRWRSEILIGVVR